MPNREQQLMIEEIMDRFPGVKILPPMNEGGVLDKHNMIPIYHKGCGRVAFYYTHRPQKNEMLMATRALFPDGTRPDRNQKMICGSCKANIDFADELEVR